MDVRGAGGLEVLYAQAREDQSMLKWQPALSAVALKCLDKNINSSIIISTGRRACSNCLPNGT